MSSDTTQEYSTSNIDAVPDAPANYSTSNNGDAATPIPLQDTAVANIIPAGQTVILFRRWVYDHGPDECLGTFKATRTFSPSVEHAQFCRDFPDYGPPSTWTANDRADWVEWAVKVGGFLEVHTPSYLFLEPWPEKPDTTQASTANPPAE